MDERTLLYIFCNDKCTKILSFFSEEASRHFLNGYFEYHSVIGLEYEGFRDFDCLTQGDLEDIFNTGSERGINRLASADRMLAKGLVIDYEAEYDI